MGFTSKHTCSPSGRRRRSIPQNRSPSRAASATHALADIGGQGRLVEIDVQLRRYARSGSRWRRCAPRRRRPGADDMHAHVGTGDERLELRREVTRTRSRLAAYASSSRRTIDRIPLVDLNTTLRGAARTRERGPGSLVTSVSGIRKPVAAMAWAWNGLDAFECIAAGGLTTRQSATSSHSSIDWSNTRARSRPRASANATGIRGRAYTAWRSSQRTTPPAMRRSPPTPASPTSSTKSYRSDAAGRSRCGRPPVSRGLDRPQQRRIVGIAEKRIIRGAAAGAGATSPAMDWRAAARRTSACHRYREGGHGRNGDTARRPRDRLDDGERTSSTRHRRTRRLARRRRRRTGPRARRTPPGPRRAPARPAGPGQSAIRRHPRGVRGPVKPGRAGRRWRTGSRHGQPCPLRLERAPGGGSRTDRSEEHRRPR